jgi:uncharacterized protein with NRDE domain
MCTVTFIPERKGPGFILTSNRDESPERGQALPPAPYNINGKDVFFPKDPGAGGTWIATSEDRFTACLLNGAFERHVWDPPYRKSRGLVLLDYFRIGNAKEFSADYDFDGIEPFTLLLLDSNRSVRFDEIRWDGKNIHHRELDPSEPAIRSSATLYDPEIIKTREHLFHDWIKTNMMPSSEEILDFHLTAGTGDRFNDLVMNRNNKVKTVSITQVIQGPKSGRMIHRDLSDQQIRQVEFI